MNAFIFATPLHVSGWVLWGGIVLWVHVCQQWTICEVSAPVYLFSTSVVQWATGSQAPHHIRHDGNYTRNKRGGVTN